MLPCVYVSWVRSRTKSTRWNQPSSQLVLVDEIRAIRSHCLDDSAMVMVTSPTLPSSHHDTHPMRCMSTMCDLRPARNSSARDPTSMATRLRGGSRLRVCWVRSFVVYPLAGWVCFGDMAVDTSQAMTKSTNKSRINGSYTTMKGTVYVG
jgi:hypothetical protein